MYAKFTYTPAPLTAEYPYRHLQTTTESRPGLAARREVRLMNMKKCHFLLLLPLVALCPAA
jgi:hypothetical protein